MAINPEYSANAHFRRSPLPSLTTGDTLCGGRRLQKDVERTLLRERLRATPQERAELFSWFHQQLDEIRRARVSGRPKDLQTIAELIVRSKTRLHEGPDESGDGSSQGR